VDSDHDGRINVSEFCAAMNMIRQAQQQEGGLLGSSQGVQFFQQEPAARQPSFAVVSRVHVPSPPQRMLLIRHFPAELSSLVIVPR